MAHELEMLNGQAQMVWHGKKPWHGLGKEVSNDLTPEEMLREAGLDWLVEKQDVVLASNHNIVLENKALVRSSDQKVLTMTGPNWNPVQNHEAFEFFNDFVLSGNMEMNTAGSLKEGKVVWALAKIKESFKVFMNDEVEGYLLFSNPHQFGKCIDIRFVAERVVCANTLSFALNENSKHQVKLNHWKKFNGDMVKEILGISKDKLELFKHQAMFLGSKRYTKESLEQYFDKVYPLTNPEEGKISRNAQKALEIIHTQPGANFAEGTFWQAMNTVTYMNDHVLGRNADSRLYSSWYGKGKLTKDRAVEVALKMATAA